MNNNALIIIDFDSTFVQTETLDEIAALNESKSIAKKIKDLTNMAMEGKISFKNALQQRIQLLSINKPIIKKVTETLTQKITPSFLKNKTFIQENAKQIYIISGGFTDIIEPIVKPFGINKENIWANHFLFNDDSVIGLDEMQNLAHDHGKCKQLESIKPKQKVYVIGDGFTDYEMKQTGLVTKFYLFAENVTRQQLISLADKIIYSFDEFIEDLNHATNE